MSARSRIASVVEGLFPGLAARRMLKRCALAEAKQAAAMLGVLASGDGDLPKILGASGYDAAARTRLQKDWPTTAYSADSSVGSDLALVNARTRDAVRNSALGRAGLRAVRRHLVGGPGITSRSSGRDPETGLESEALKAFGRIADLSFNRWARNRLLCDLERKKTFAGLQRGWVNDFVSTGQCFALPVVVRDRLGVHLAVQWLEYEQLDASKYVWPHAVASGENAVVGGIEIDRYGGIVAYWFYRREHPLEGATGDSERVPAERVLHYLDQERARQTHGLSMFVSILFDLWARKQYRLYAMVRARMEQCVSVFLKGGKSAAASKAFGLNTRPGESGTNDNSDAVRNLEPGLIQPLGKDVEPHFLDPRSPGANYGPFMFDTAVEIAAGLGLDYATLTRDTTRHNMSSLKVGLATTAAELDPIGYDLIDILLRPIREEWTRLEIALGRLEAPNFYRSEAWEAAYLETTWQLPKRITPTPQQDAAANDQDLRNFVASPKGIIGETGESAEDVLSEIAEFRDRLIKLGLPLPAFLQPSPGRAASQGGGDAPEGGKPPKDDAPPEDDSTRDAVDEPEEALR